MLPRALPWARRRLGFQPAVAHLSNQKLLKLFFDIHLVEAQSIAKSSTNYHHTPAIMLVKLQLKSLPFSPVSSQVIYTSGLRDERIEEFIAKNLDLIEKSFSAKGLTFYHIPTLSKQINDNRSFYAPYAYGAPSASLESDWALSHLAVPGNASKVAPMLLFFCEESVDACYGFTLDAWKAKTDEDFLQIFADLAQDIERLTRIKIEGQDIIRSTRPKSENKVRGEVRYSVRKNRIPVEVAPVEADENFDAESQKLIEEVRERINKLRYNGLSASLINSLFHQEESLSTLRIDANYRLWLTDYGNLEIRMTPLVKAVYLLFISHPEGILFKCLADYRAELRRIYAELRHSPLSEAEEESVRRLTDPFNNSINEKCARIREAFCREIRPSLAEHYIIDGYRGEAKKMQLPRELIIWD